MLFGFQFLSYTLFFFSPQEYQRDIDGRTTFKLLRSLAAQLKINSSYKEDEDCVNEFVQACCATLGQSQDLTADDTEFTQGVLSLYHLVTLSLSSPDKSDICVLLSKTILVCYETTVLLTCIIRLHMYLINNINNKEAKNINTCLHLC